MSFSFDILHSSRQNPLLVEILKKLMAVEELKDFRLVGGTNLALRFDHRYSVDIDLFTDKEYGTVDFDTVETEPDPVCYMGKEWAEIKLDIITQIESLKE